MSAGQARIVIAGTGPVGLMTAALLASDARAAAIDLRVVDAAGGLAWSESDLDLRVYALSRASQSLFERLGLWHRVRDRRASPYRAMRVWQGDDPDGVASVFFESATIGEPDLGHIVEDRLLRHVLLEFLLRMPNVRVDFDSPIVSFERGARRARVGMAGGEQIRADLLIGADGAASQVRALAGIGTFGHAYGQRALVAHVESAEPHRETAWQRFGELGPLALLPLADGRSSVVWSVPERDAERLAGMDDAAFESELDRASGNVLGRLRIASARAGFPLQFLHASRYTIPSVVLAGDAAHAVHPLAGQGMNLGLLDAAALAAVIGDAHAAGEYIGDRYVLDRYARARRAHNLQMQVAFDALDRVFRLGGPMPVLAAAGMLAVDAVPTLKRFIVERALGVARARRLRAG